MAASTSIYEPDTQKVEQTVTIISAYVSHNTVSTEALPDLIRSVYATLDTLSLSQSAPKAPEKAVTPAVGPVSDVIPEPPVPEKSVSQEHTPAVPIKRSVFPDYIVCLEDGKKTKMLKSYIQRHFNLTPEDYRTRWGLPPEYPMVAPNYSAQRAAIAKRNSLGRRGDDTNATLSSGESHIASNRKARGRKTK
ncbi:transcriptional regulator (plasmid) [Acetobacter pasteurianus NBRC 101655]|uniref:Transcriptional regulator Ros/MucR n=2 Tax=Acetobacter TaxID=434 RepID=A0A2G4RES1_9PROT|nr:MULTISPECIES: MucR family transcriptional regulator [Acetobacter]BAU39755.1 transcriptional regulator [Acetobacter pasteurianus NBRC 101655]ANA15293.1 transcriptional regulator Ros/MucR [Acetobacter oryzifermentans]PHY94990.1 transcriptional regulator Ros/MucR [Acetobacter pomorum]CCT60975.1 transcriptional regulator [Acetobacter pasteurianus 386B]GBR54171.1 Ros/MucR family transcriptional regulator [Acetobacter pomorum DSM 11825]